MSDGSHLLAHPINMIDNRIATKIVEASLAVDTNSPVMYIVDCIQLQSRCPADSHECVDIIMDLQHFDAKTLAANLPFSLLIDHFESALAEPSKVPIRTKLDGAAGRETLIMPVFSSGHTGVKILNVVPENRQRNRPVVCGLFVLFNGDDGSAIAAMDASELTARRTAAVSALASRKLSRRDSKTLLVVGSGHLAPYLAEAHAAVRPIETIRVWARDLAKANNCRMEISRRVGDDLDVAIERDLAEGVQASDIVTAATRAQNPLIKGKWVRPGVHIDLVGGYRPDMREIDDLGISKTRIFVDNTDAVLVESGDIISPLQRGVIAPEKIEGDLTALLQGGSRNTQSEITLFKSVGSAATDLAAAEFALTSCKMEPPFARSLPQAQRTY